MKLVDLIQKFRWDEVQNNGSAVGYHNLLRLYPDQENSLAGYEHVYGTLLSTFPVETNLRIMVAQSATIIVEHVQEDVQGEYWDVSGKGGETETSCAIEFQPWGAWLGMEIANETRPRCSEMDILCHCLWEMTFFGYTPKEVQEIYDDILQTAKDFAPSCTMTLDELLDELQSTA